MNKHFIRGSGVKTIKKTICFATPPVGSPLIVPGPPALGKAIITHNEVAKMNSGNRIWSQNYLSKH